MVRSSNARTARTRRHKPRRRHGCVRSAANGRRRSIAASANAVGTASENHVLRRLLTRSLPVPTSSATRAQRRWLSRTADDTTKARNRALIDTAETELVERDGRTYMLRRLASPEQSRLAAPRAIVGRAPFIRSLA